MRITKRQLKRIIKEEYSRLMEEKKKKKHAFMKHDMKKDKEKYFDFLDEYMELESDAAVKAAEKAGLDLNILKGMNRSYQGRTRDGRFIHSDGQRYSREDFPIKESLSSADLKKIIREEYRKITRHNRRRR